MMKEEFKEWRPRGETLTLLQRMQEVIEHYQALNIRMTLRQLYYQLVARDILPNQVKYYQKLSIMLTRARMAGIVDWDAIEDRTRIPRRHSEWPNLRSLMDSAERSFRLPRHAGQPIYAEVWCEKDAISSVLRPVTDAYHAYLSVNRGYSSASAIYDASKRFLEAQDEGKILKILYAGDHDSSGLDMDRDITERLAEFGADVEFIRVALTDEQIKQYNPPPNPTKHKDPRAGGYIAKYGNTSWEVDALPPEVLNVIVTNAILEQMDMDPYERIIEIEDAMRPRIRDAGDVDDDFRNELQEIEEMRQKISEGQVTEGMSE